MLAAVHGAHQRHLEAPQREVADPAGSPRVRVHHVDAFGLHQRPEQLNIAQPLPVAAVADANFYLRGPGGQVVRIRHHPHGVALRPVRLGQLHGVGHRARKEFRRKHVKDAHEAKVLPLGTSQSKRNAVLSMTVLILRSNLYACARPSTFSRYFWPLPVFSSRIFSSG